MGLMEIGSGCTTQAIEGLSHPADTLTHCCNLSLEVTFIPHWKNDTVLKIESISHCRKDEK